MERVRLKLADQPPKRVAKKLHGNAKLTVEQVISIFKSKETGAALAVRYGVSESTVRAVQLGLSRKSITQALV